MRVLFSSNGPVSYYLHCDYGSDPRNGPPQVVACWQQTVCRRGGAVFRLSGLDGFKLLISDVLRSWPGFAPVFTGLGPCFAGCVFGEYTCRSVAGGPDSALGLKRIVSAATSGRTNFWFWVNADASCSLAPCGVGPPATPVPPPIPIYSASSMFLQILSLIPIARVLTFSH